MKAIATTSNKIFSPFSKKPSTGFIASSAQRAEEVNFQKLKNLVLNGGLKITKKDGVISIFHPLFIKGGFQGNGNVRYFPGSNDKPYFFVGPKDFETSFQRVFGVNTYTPKKVTPSAYAGEKDPEKCANFEEILRSLRNSGELKVETHLSGKKEVVYNIYHESFGRVYYFAGDPCNAYGYRGPKEYERVFQKVFGTNYWTPSSIEVTAAKLFTHMKNGVIYVEVGDHAPSCIFNDNRFSRRGEKAIWALPAGSTHKMVNPPSDEELGKGVFVTLEKEGNVIRLIGDGPFGLKYSN